MNPDLDTLATALYVTVDDLLLAHPGWVPERPAVGIVPKLSDAELVTLAVIQALLGYTSEARFLRYARVHLRPWFPYLPTRSAYNKRLRRSSGMMQHIINYLSRLSPSFREGLWLVDSTPVECGRSRQTTQRSELAGWAELRILRVPLPLLLGTAAPSVGHRVGSADHLGARSSEARRTRHRPGHGRERGCPPAGQDHRGGQRLSAGQLREHPQRGRDHPHPPGYENRETPTGTPVPASVPPDHRIDQQHPQGPARSRTARRPYQSRCRSTRHPTPTSTHRCHLAQPNHQPARTSPIPHRLRPLTIPWN